MSESKKTIDKEPNEKKTCRDCCICLICCRVDTKKYEAKKRISQAGDDCLLDLQKSNPECYNKLFCICCCCFCFQKANKKKANEKTEISEENSLDIVVEQPEANVGVEDEYANGNTDEIDIQ